jgi:hypothetical protein
MDARRRLLIAAAPLALAGCGGPGALRFPDIDSAVRAVRGLVPEGRSSGAWPLPQTLEHLAQSIEYSITGYPQPRAAWFQASVGRAAFAVFDARGRMHHALDEPIPGAPALAAKELPPAAERLVQALRRFEAHTGPLQPHFAYGALDKPHYTRAHLLHLADHWSDFHAKEPT